MAAITWSLDVKGIKRFRVPLWIERPRWIWRWVEGWGSWCLCRLPFWMRRYPRRAHLSRHTSTLHRRTVRRLSLSPFPILDQHSHDAQNMHDEIVRLFTGKRNYRDILTSDNLLASFVCHFDRRQVVGKIRMRRRRKGCLSSLTEERNIILARKGEIICGKALIVQSDASRLRIARAQRSTISSPTIRSR